MDQGDQAGGLEVGPGSASQLEVQQRSKAPMDQGDHEGRLEVSGDPTAGMDGQVPSNSLECNKCKTEEQRLHNVLQLQAQRLEDEINEVKKTGVGRMARVFKMKQKIVGNRKVG